MNDATRRSLATSGRPHRSTFRPTAALLLALLPLAPLGACRCSSPEGPPRSSEAPEQDRARAGSVAALANCGDGPLQAAAILGEGGDPARALELLRPPAQCPQARLLLPLAQLFAGQRAAALESLRALSGDAAAPFVAARARELLALELAGADPKATAEAKGLAEAAVRSDGELYRARALRIALLRRGGDRAAVDAALRDFLVPAPRFLDPADLFLKEASPWILDALLQGGLEAPAALGAEGHAALGELLYGAGRRRLGRRFREFLEAARSELALARATAQASEERLLLEARVSAELQDFPAVVELLQPELVKAPDSVALRTELFSALNRLGRDREIVDLGLPPSATCAPCLLRRAEALARLRDPSAPAALEAAAALLPFAPRVRLLRAQQLLAQQKSAQAIEELYLALGDGPEHLGVLETLSKALTVAGRKEDAAEIAAGYKRALERSEQAQRAEQTAFYAASGAREASEALQRGDLAEAARQIGFVQERAADFPLLPWLRMSLALAKQEPLDPADREAALEGLAARNPWLDADPGAP